MTPTIRFCDSCSSLLKELNPDKDQKTLKSTINSILSRQILDENYNQNKLQEAPHSSQKGELFSKKQRKVYEGEQKRKLLTFNTFRPETIKTFSELTHYHFSSAY